jgi:hypothetical protein
MEGQPAAVPAPGLSQLQRVTYTFSAPSKTFEDIKRGNRSWWMPWAIYAIVGYIFFAAISLKIGMQTVVDNQIHMDPKAEERLAQAPPESREMSNKISMGITEGVFIGGPVVILLYAAVIAVVLWGTINFVFGGKATFGQVFCVWFFANLPQLFKSLLGTVIIFAGAAPETFNIKNYSPTNFGAFLNPIETNRALYTLASSLDVVSIWTLALLSIGVATVAGVKRSSGYIAVFGWWALIVLVGVGFAAIMG